jgi:hypothetical protein
MAHGIGVGAGVGGVTPQPYSALFTAISKQFTKTPSTFWMHWRDGQALTSSLPKAMFTARTNSLMVTAPSP